MKTNYIPYIPCLIESSPVAVSYILLKYSILFSYLKSLSVKGKLIENWFPEMRYPAMLDYLHISTVWPIPGSSLLCVCEEELWDAF